MVRHSQMKNTSSKSIKDGVVDGQGCAMNYLKCNATCTTLRDFYNGNGKFGNGN